MVRVYWYPYWAKCFIQDDEPPWPKEWTYFIHGEDGHVKIGTTGDLDNRLNQIDRGVPFHVTPVLALDSRLCGEQSAFSKFNDWRKKGEWFWPSPPLIKFMYAPEE